MRLKALIRAESGFIGLFLRIFVPRKRKRVEVKFCEPAYRQEISLSKPRIFLIY